MSGHDDRPLVVTAELDDATFAWLDALRRRHFPPEHNRLAAHLTLFHALPGGDHDRVSRDLEEVVSARAAIEAEAAGWMLLGRGVAMALEAPGLVALRADLASRLGDVLTRQDAGGFRPHVTVQNKVTPGQARALKARLDLGYRPRPVGIPALCLWHYDGGPWQFVRRFGLAGERADRGAERLGGSGA